MIEVLRIATGVATPLALLGLVAALGYFIYCRRLKYQEAVLRSLPDTKRARVVDEQLTRYKLDASNLTREQKYNLVLREMETRHQRARFMIITLAVVCVLSFAIAVWGYFQVNLSPAGRVSQPSTSADAATRGDGSHAINAAGASPGRDLIIAVTPPPNQTPAASAKSVADPSPPPLPPESFPAPTGAAARPLSEDAKKSAHYKQSYCYVRNRTDQPVAVGFSYIPRDATDEQRSRYAHWVSALIQPNDESESLWRDGGGFYHVSLFSAGSWKPTNTWYDLRVVARRTVTVSDDNGSFRVEVTVP